MTEQQLKAPNTSLQRNYYLSLYHMGILEKQKNSEIRKKVRTLKGGKMVQKSEPGEPEENFFLSYFLRETQVCNELPFYDAKRNGNPCYRFGCLTEDRGRDMLT